MNRMLKEKIFLALLAVAAAGTSAFAAPPAEPRPKPPVDVLADRQRHYDTLDAARDRALREYPIRHDADGNVIKDAAYEAAIADYDRKKAASTESLRTDTRRDGEVTLLRNQAGIVDDPKVGIDTGTPPGDPKYGGTFSDRDVRVDKTEQMHALADAAARRGYTIEHGGDYIRIKELDVVVWNPDKVRFRPGAEGTTIVERLHDPEFVLGATGDKKSRVAQQIKKAEHDLRRNVPNDTRGQHEMVTNISKAGYKAVDGVERGGAVGVVPEESRARLEAMKGRKQTVDDIADPFDRLEARRRKIENHKTEVETALRESLKVERQQRRAEATRIKQNMNALQREIDLTTDGTRKQVLRDKLHREWKRSEALKDVQKADDLTLHVVNKKNPGVRERVIRPEGAERVTGGDAPHTTKGSKFSARAAFGLSIVGKGLGIFQAFSTELSDSTRDDRKFSQARMSVHLASNITGVAGVIAAVEGFQYETGRGMQEYVDSEIERLQAEGFDVSKMPGLQDVVYRRALLRATGRATWQIVKAIPFVGDIASGAEDAYNLTEATVGLGYDALKSWQIQQQNRMEQKEQHENFAALAEAMRDALRKQIAGAEAYVREADEIAARQAENTATIEALETRVRATLQNIWAATAVADGPPSAIAANKLAEIDPYLQSVTKAADAFAGDADVVLRQTAAGEIDRDDLFERRGGFTRRMQAIDADYIDASQRLDTARAEAERLAASGDLVSLRQSLTFDLETAAAAADATDALAERMESIDRRYAELVRCFDDQKKRLREMCEGRVYRLVSDPIKETLRFIRAQIVPMRLPQLSMDAHAVRSRELRLQRDRLRLMIEQAREGAGEASETPRTPGEVESADAWKRVTASADAMEKSVAAARDRMRRLRDAAPSEPPIFELTAELLEPMSFRFDFRAANLPPAKKRFFMWNFGDGVGVEGDKAEAHSRRHRFERPGRYTVVVGVYEETPNFSMKIGEATATVDAVAATTPTPTERGPNAPACEFSRGVTFTIDGGKQRLAVNMNNSTPVPMFRTMNAGDFEATAFGNMYFNPKTNRMRCEIVNGLATIYTSETGFGSFGRLPWYRIEFSATAEGPWNPQTGEFSLAFSGGRGRGSYNDVKSIIKNGPIEVDRTMYTAEERNAAADVVRQLGYDADALGWNGTFSGRFDWNGFQGGSGRLELNRLIRGSWKEDAVGSHALVVPEELRMIGGRPRHVTVAYFPDEEAASRWLRQPINRPTREEFADLADEVRETMQRGPPRYIFRHGRFLIEASVIPLGSATHDQLAEFLRNMRYYLAPR